ncbi:MAG: citrate synthase, partial [Cryptosporangiaceae bacterium]|nr:citrate synthase [Cryptosporangiaceae bacterium]
SRGFVTSVRGADGRRSAFDTAEIDRLAARPRRAAGRPAGLSIHTRLAGASEDGLSYRGRSATELARHSSFEAVTSLLWTGELESTEMLAPPELASAARALVHALPSGATALDRLGAGLGGLAAADPLKGDLRPEAVVATGRTLLAGLVAALPERPGHTDAVPGTGLAARLWPKLSHNPASSGAAALLDAALVLLADGEFTAATLAARIAASARAHPYAVAAAGLAALAAPGQTPPSAAVHRALADAEGEGLAPVLARLLGAGALPGFGHPLFPGGDPRARTLLELLGAAPPDPFRWKHVTGFLAASSRGTPVPPSTGFALGALSYTAGMPAGAGELIFALARIAGWIGHALEEYAEDPGRLRATATYTGENSDQP